MSDSALQAITNAVRNYSGRELRLMEVCGTHTAAIAEAGIRSLLSPHIRLISGPGCPVCVTVTDYIDRLVALSQTHTVAAFGDLLRVRGSGMSLNDARAAGGRVQMVYSPMQLLELAAERPQERFVFAAVGFETTAPVYAMLLTRARERGLTNLQLLTSLKTMPPVIDWICRERGGIDGFLAPGHVCAVTGSSYFEELSQKYGLPFVVAGFDGPQLLSAIYTLLRREGRAGVVNLYRSVVTSEGNQTAQQAVEQWFEACDAAWRGMGVIPASGLRLRQEWAAFDAGSIGLDGDSPSASGCCCAEVLTGARLPEECPLFGRACTPHTPQGACMVSMEGSCFHHFVQR